MTPISSHEHLPYIDTDSVEYIDDPFATLTRAGATRGIARGPHGVEIFSYAQVKNLLDHKQLQPTGADFFKGQGATLPILEFINDGLLLMMEPKRHLAVRKVLVKGFKPRTIEANRKMMAEFAHQLLDDIRDRNTMDFVGDFSHHYAIGVISRFIGVEPEDVPLFEHATVELRVLAENPMQPFVPRLEKALAELRAYAEKLVAARRKEKRSDLISDLIEAQESEGKLTEVELIWAVVNVLLAGHDTTRFQLASCVRSILEANAWNSLAAEPALIPKAIDEGMRLWPVTTRLRRVVSEPVEICGEMFAPGEAVSMSFHGAGRDPQVFANPNTLDLHREKNWDIGFGYGPHYCLGHAVAHAEMCEALNVLVKRLGSVQLKQVVMPGHTSAFMRGPEQMDIAFEWLANA